jgi:hypothetical protein
VRVGFQTGKPLDVSVARSPLQATWTELASNRSTAQRAASDPEQPPACLYTL